MRHPSEEPQRSSESVKSSSELEIGDARVLLSLVGPRNERLKALERAANVSVGLRGNKILLDGNAENVALAERFLAEAAALLADGIDVPAADLARALRLLRSEPHLRLRDMFDQVVSLGAGRRPVGPRSPAQ